MDQRLRYQFTKETIANAIELLDDLRRVLVTLAHSIPEPPDKPPKSVADRIRYLFKSNPNTVFTHQDVCLALGHSVGYRTVKGTIRRMLVNNDTVRTTGRGRFQLIRRGPRTMGRLADTPDGSPQFLIERADGKQTVVVVPKH